MPVVSINYIAVYFNRKGMEWASKANSIEEYVRNVGVDGLTLEFVNDPSFVNVCIFIRNVGTIQLRSNIAKGLEGGVGVLFGIPLMGVMDIIIGAIEGACGKKVAGELILKGVTGVLIGAVIIGVLSAITK